MFLISRISLHDQVNLNFPLFREVLHRLENFAHSAITSTKKGKVFVNQTISIDRFDTLVVRVCAIFTSWG